MHLWGSQLPCSNDKYFVSVILTPLGESGCMVLRCIVTLIAGTYKHSMQCQCSTYSYSYVCNNTKRNSVLYKVLYIVHTVMQQCDNVKRNNATLQGT